MALPTGQSSMEIQAQALRQAAVRELLEEESNFCYSLHHAGQLVLSMRALEDKSQRHKSKVLDRTEEILSSLQTAHRTFFSAMVQCNSQADLALVMGMVFKQLFHTYQGFCGAFDQLVTEISIFSWNSGEVFEMCSSVQEVLVMPFKRVLSYRTFVSVMVRHTPDSCAEVKANLVAAMTILHQLCVPSDTIENLLSLQSILSEIQFCATPLINPIKLGRKYLRQCHVRDLSGKRLYLLLCSDILLVCEVKSTAVVECVSVFQVARLQVDPTTFSAPAQHLQLRNAGTLLSFDCASQSEMLDLAYAIQGCIRACRISGDVPDIAKLRIEASIEANLKGKYAPTFHGPVQFEAGPGVSSASLHASGRGSERLWDSDKGHEPRGREGRDGGWGGGQQGSREGKRLGEKGDWIRESRERYQALLERTERVTHQPVRRAKAAEKLEKTVSGPENRSALKSEELSPRHALTGPGPSTLSPVYVGSFSSSSPDSFSHSRSTSPQQLSLKQPGIPSGSAVTPSRTQAVSESEWDREDERCGVGGRIVDLFEQKLRKLGAEFEEHNHSTMSIERLIQDHTPAPVSRANIMSGGFDDFDGENHGPNPGSGRGSNSGRSTRGILSSSRDSHAGSKVGRRAVQLSESLRSLAFPPSSSQALRIDDNNSSPLSGSSHTRARRRLPESGSWFDPHDTRNSTRGRNGEPVETRALLHRRPATPQRVTIQTSPSSLTLIIEDRASTAMQSGVAAPAGETRTCMLHCTNTQDAVSREMIDTKGTANAAQKWRFEIERPGLGDAGRGGVEGWLMEKSTVHRANGVNGSTIGGSIIGANVPASVVAPTSVTPVDSAWWIQVPGMPPLATLWIGKHRHGVGELYVELCLMQAEEGEDAVFGGEIHPTDVQRAEGGKAFVVIHSLVSGQEVLRVSSGVAVGKDIPILEGGLECSMWYAQPLTPFVAFAASCAVLSYAPSFPLHPQRTPQKKPRGAALAARGGGAESMEGRREAGTDRRSKMNDGGVEMGDWWGLDEDEDRDHDDYV